MDVSNDMKDFESSYTKALRDKAGVPSNYISLYNGELDDYLLYNIEDDSVILVEEGNARKLQSGNFDKHWKSFDSFLLDFFRLSN